MIYDCFFSYQHEDLRLVETLVNKLEIRGLRCWYAPRNIQGRYAKAIAEGITHSKVFVLILNHRSATSEEVLNEVEYAHNVAKQSPYAVIQPILSEELDFTSVEYGEMMYYIRRIQFINAVNEKDYDELASKIILSQPQLQQNSALRTTSNYVIQDLENQRLHTQNNLLNSFDGDVYEKVLARYDAPSVFDVGCGTGAMMLSKLNDTTFSVYLGIDKSKELISLAQGTTPHAENVHFLASDVTSETFSAEIKDHMKEYGIEGFDVIVVSMLLLHLQNPQRLLASLKPILSTEGTVIIRDIDDGINFAYPDPKKAFERVYRICEYDDQTGNRRNGRQIYSDLIKAGFSRITLEHQGLSSVGMNDVEKECLFKTYFPFIRDNTKLMAEKYPSNLEYKENAAWYEANFDEMHEAFMRPDFVFSLGFMSYTAQK